MKIAILFGGQSAEHNVSRKSAYSVIKNIDTELFEIVTIGITKKGMWLPYYGAAEAIPDGSWEKSIAYEAQNPIGNCLDIISSCDVVFPVLHGQNGEDGTVQGLLELLGVPYVGCGILSSATCMDKFCVKSILRYAKIPQCRYVAVYRHVLEQDINAYNAEIAEKIGYPCFVKPAGGGSSVGVHKVKTEAKLQEALLDAQKFDRKVLVEEFVDGREIECAVLGNINAKAAAPGEIIPSKEFYDYEDKYIKNESRQCIPADIPPETAQSIKNLALRAYNALDCSGLARVDFFLKKDGTVLLNEINTMPGFTEISMYSKMWEAEGMSFKSLITELINLAFSRKNETSRHT